MRVAVRFAPSPTGPLHVGNARMALLNYLFARRHGGNFLLRFDDTDRARSRPAFAAAILEDLGWLGIAWQGPEHQSKRLAVYAEAAARLRASGRLYACYESETELRNQRDALRKAGRPPIYDRTGRGLSALDRARLEAAGRKPHWRFLLSGESVAWQDLVLGERRIPLSSLSDPILLREDATPLYIFTSVVDDRDFAITHVIRGEDHVTNTAVQADLWAALGETEVRPAFAHLPLLADAGGAKLSKRLGSLGIRRLREDGVTPVALTSYLARLGTSGDAEPATLAALAETFDLAQYSRSPARFDLRQLLALNHRVLQQMPFSEVAASLPQGASEEFWQVIRENVERVGEAREWWQVVAGEISPPPLAAEAGYLRIAASLLPPEPWGETTWKAYAEALGKATGRHGRALFHPLRLALTGVEDGPALARLLPLIGRPRAAARLEAAARSGLLKNAGQGLRP